MENRIWTGGPNVVLATRACSLPPELVTSRSLNRRCRRRMSSVLFLRIVPLFHIGIFFAQLFRFFQFRGELVLVHDVFDLPGFLWIDAKRKSAESSQADRCQSQSKHQARR